MKINHNIAALNAYRNLAVNNSSTAKSLEKLSSGLRINRASDDAAGLAISEKMRSQIRGLDMAERNALDGVSFVQTAEGALSSTHDMLQRMRELAVQAANDSNTSVDRDAIQQEINQLTNEINRVSNATEFNTKKLLDGSLSNEATVTTVTPGLADTTGTGSTQPTAVTVGGISFSFTSAGAVLNGYTIELGTVADGTTESASVDTINKKIIINGDFDNTDASGTYSSSANIKAAIEAAFAAKGGSFAGIVATAGAGAAVAAGTASTAISGGTNATASTAGVYQFQVGPQDITIDGITFTYSTTPTAGKWSNQTELQALIQGSALNTQYTIDSSVAGKIQLTQKHNFESTFAPQVDNGNLVNLQIGANQGQIVSLEIKDMRSSAIGLSRIDSGGQKDVTLINGVKVTAWYTGTPTSNNGITNTLTDYALDVSTHDHAAAAITIFNDAIERVSAERSRMGSIQNRLEHTVDNLKYMSENTTAAESRVRDLDMALEMTAYTKNNILVQSAQAMLAQANQLPQGVLQLLK